MPALDPTTTVVIKLVTKDDTVNWTLLGLWSEFNDYQGEPLMLGMHSATTYYADVIQLGLDPAECLAYKTAKMEHYRLSKVTAEPVTAEWWIAYQKARADEWNLAAKIRKTVQANFRTYTDQLILSAPPPWAEFMTFADGLRLRVA